MVSTLHSNVTLGLSLAPLKTYQTTVSQSFSLSRPQGLTQKMRWP